MVDSTILILIVFHASPEKYSLLTNSIIVKIIVSLAMTPVVYAIVIGINRYLGGNIEHTSESKNTS